MNQSPSVYWRKQQKIKHLLNKIGEIISVTKIEGQKHYSGIIKIGDQNISASIIANDQIPQPADKVKGVLRIIKENGKSGLIEYGIKFQLV